MSKILECIQIDKEFLENEAKTKLESEARKALTAINKKTERRNLWEKIVVELKEELHVLRTMGWLRDNTSLVPTLKYDNQLNESIAIWVGIEEDQLVVSVVFPQSNFNHRIIMCRKDTSQCHIPSGLRPHRNACGHCKNLNEIYMAIGRFLNRV